MGKYFEITYSPAAWTTPPGGMAVVWNAPYGGLHVQAPENIIDPRFSPALNNVILRNAEMRSRPQFRQFLQGPDNTNPILALGSFLSPVQVWHTFSMTPRGLFQLQTAHDQAARLGKNPWSYLGGPSLAQFVPVSWQAYAGILYYTNGAHLSAWDGRANAPINDVAFLGASAAGSTTFGGFFLTELANRLLLGYVTETTAGAASVFPNRIRWSNNGFNPTLGGVFGANLGTNGATFDPAINPGAGSNDFVDVPDLLTGVMTVGRTGFFFRQNGVTEVSPTGNGVSPFDFNHLWASQNGIGNVYPFSIAQYGAKGMFISFENVHMVSADAPLRTVGGGARDAIMTDLANATDIPKASMDRGFNLGYTYLLYNLMIPIGNNMRVYAYSVEDDHWMRWTLSNTLPTGQSNECWM